jgi:putative addiction module component (TIGR02574 family)
MSRAVLQNALKLSVPERLELIEELWESIRQNPDALPVTAPQREELDRRLADHAAEPEAGYSIDDVINTLADKE